MFVAYDTANPPGREHRGPLAFPIPAKDTSISN